MLLEPFMSDRSVQLPSPSFADAVGPVAVKRILEAALLTRPDPIPLSELKKLFEEELGVEVLRRLLDELRTDWEEKGVELVHVAGGWRFQAKPEMQKYLNRLNPQKPPRYAGNTCHHRLSSTGYPRRHRRNKRGGRFHPDPQSARIARLDSFNRPS